MNVYGDRIKAGELIVLQRNGKKVRHQVEQSEHYSDQPDLWIAQLITLS